MGIQGEIMRNRYERVLLTVAAVVLAAVPCFSKYPDNTGTISLWASTHVTRSAVPILGFRFLPGITYEKALSGGATLRFEGSLNVFGALSFPYGGVGRFDGLIQAYRGWVRYATPRFETRLGLQRLNFGSASLLRPLMWFDSLDPRDPLQLTDGVWGLYGNSAPKGWEVSATARRPEFGGRVQLPVPKGEVALTYHHRRMSHLSGFGNVGENIPEDRLGFDGKWDLGVGLWFEGTIVKAQASVLPLPYRRALTVGADYTFAVGNGLHVLGEHFLMQDSATAFGAGRGMKISAASLSYPLGILDALSGMFYYDWENDSFFRFLSWKRTYDHWSLLVIGFWNPETLSLYRASTAGATFGGKGLQVMAVFNY